MPRKAKEKPIIVEEPVACEPGVNAIGFKLKFTNIRKTAYPDIKPERSDLFYIRRGDIMIKGNAIYEVTDIIRVPIDPPILTQWKNKNILRKNKNILNFYNGKNNYKNEPLGKKLEEYEKNGSFGVCKITLKCIYRNAVKIANPRTTSFLEVTNNYILKNSGGLFYPADIGSIISDNRHSLARAEGLLARAKTKKDLANKSIELWEEIEKYKTEADRKKREEENTVAVTAVFN